VYFHTCVLSIYSNRCLNLSPQKRGKRKWTGKEHTRTTENLSCITCAWEPSNDYVYWSAVYLFWQLQSFHSIAGKFEEQLLCMVTDVTSVWIAESFHIVSQHVGSFGIKCDLALVLYTSETRMLSVQTKRTDVSSVHGSQKFSNNWNFDVILWLRLHEQFTTHKKTRWCNKQKFFFSSATTFFCEVVALLQKFE